MLALKKRAGVRNAQKLIQRTTSDFVFRTKIMLFYIQQGAPFLFNYQKTLIIIFCITELLWRYKMCFYYIYTNDTSKIISLLLYVQMEYELITYNYNI